MADGSIVIETDLDNSGVKSGLSKLKGTVAKGVAALGIGTMFKKSMDVGSSFESAMSEVKAISGASGKDFEKLTETAKEMGASTKFSATESAEALKYMSMAGWDTKQMVSGLAGVMDLAAASGESLGTVSDIVTDAMTAFGLEAKESTHFADVLAKASSSSNTNVGMMGETFKYVAPIAGAMKYSVEDTATAIGLMANAGIKGGEAGTALRSVLTRLVKPPKEAAEALDNLGISAKNSDGTMKPLREVLGDLREKFAGLDDSQKAQYAASIAGQEGMSGLLAIVNASEGDFQKLTNAIDNSKDAAKKQADTMNNNLKGAMCELGSAAEAAGIEIYDGFKKPLTKMVKEGAKKIRGLATAIKENEIESIVPDEVMNGVKNLGSIAKTVGGGGIKVLSKSVKGLADNLNVVIPLTTTILGAMAGYKAFTVASNGVMALTTAYKALQAMEAANAITLVAQEGGLSLLQTTVGIFTGKISLATAATGMFNAACTALGGPIGVAIVAVGALAAGLGAYGLISGKLISEEKVFADKVEKSAEKQKEYLKSIEGNRKAREEAIETTQTEGKQASFLAEKLNDLMSVENKSAGQKEQIKTIVEKLNELLPDLGLAYDEEKDKLNQSTDAIRKNIAAQKELAMAKAYGAQMEGITEDILKTEDKLAKATEQRTKAEEKLAKAKKELGDKVLQGDKFAIKEMTELKAAYESADEQVKKYQKSIEGLNEDLETASNREIGYANYGEFLGSIDEVCEEAKIKAGDIPESVSQGIKDGLYVNPMTGEELNALMNLDGLVQKALEEGKEVSFAVAQGIQSGQYALPESTAALENMVKFDGMIRNAGVQGEKLSVELANKIAQGKMTIDEAVLQMCDAAGLTPEQFGITQVLDKAAQETKKSSDEIKKSIEIASTDNSEAAKASESSFTDNYGKGPEKVKKSSSEMSKNSGIKGQDNSGSAKKTVDTYTDNLEKGEAKAKTAAKNLEKAGTEGLGADASEAKKAGEKLGEAFADGITSKAGSVKKAGKKAASSGKSGANAEKEGFVTVGKNISSGIASGINANSGVVAEAARRVIRNAKKAANSESDSHSPSRVFRDEVGKFLPLGVAVGIEKHTGAVEKASRGMAHASVEAAADELGIHSPSKAFQNIVGVNIPKGIAAGISVAKTELTAEMRSTMNEVLATAQKAASEGKYSQIGSDLAGGLSESLSLAKSRGTNSLQESMNAQYDSLMAAHKKAEDKLQSKIKKTKSKKNKKKRKKQLSKLKAANKQEAAQLQEAGEKVSNAFNTAFEKEAERLTQIAQKQLQELSENYQKEYDRIAGLRDSLTNKQQSWGNIYDLRQNISDIERYQKQLKALENKVPESMMERILGMNVDEASAYMDWFQAMSNEQQKVYIANWNKQQSMSETFSNSFFAEDFAKLEKQYQTELKKATDSLQKQIQQAGVNIAKGLTEGIESETRSASKAIKNLCKNLIKTARKQLGIKSPSREFAEIGRYDILGMEKGHEKEAKKLYRQMEDVSETMAQRFARARLNIPELQGRMQAAVHKQMRRITADVQVPHISQNAVSGKETERIVYAGPEKIELVSVLDGREVARCTVPFMDQFLNDAMKRRLRGGV